MAVTAAQSLADVATLDELYAALTPLRITPGWHKKEASLWDEPRKSYVPMHWSYETGRAALDAAGRLIDTSLAERRNLILFNPAEGNAYATTRTIITAYQMILPGERARSHRHSPNALRLILDSAPGTYSTVDGVKVPMETGDVVLTPGWMWHGHGNEGNAPAYWIDYLDVPLVHLLEPMFYEQHPQEYETVIRSGVDSPLLFRWADTEPKLASAPRDAKGYYGRTMELKHEMPTLGLHMMALDAKQQTEELRTTASNVYSVVKGRGSTTVDGETFHWQFGDVISAPSWRPHHHRADEDAVLFRVTDEPVLRVLGFLR